MSELNEYGLLALLILMPAFYAGDDSSDEEEKVSTVQPLRRNHAPVVRRSSVIRPVRSHSAPPRRSTKKFQGESID